MRYHELVTEHKKGRRAVKHNTKPRNPVAHAAQTVAKGSGPHKDKKRAAKQGNVKHKAQSIEEGVSYGTMGAKAAQQLLAAFNDASRGVEHFSRDEAAVKGIYDALKETASEQGVLPHLKSLLDSAHGYARMEFDTNPGDFKNWWPFVGQLLEGLVKIHKEKGDLEDEPDFELDTKEQIEEKKKYYFAGAKVGHKEGPAGQLRTGPAKAGKLVGGG